MSSVIKMLAENGDLQTLGLQTAQSRSNLHICGSEGRIFYMFGGP